MIYIDIVHTPRTGYVMAVIFDIRGSGIPGFGCNFAFQVFSFHAWTSKPEALEFYPRRALRIIFLCIQGYVGLGLQEVRVRFWRLLR